MRGKGYNLLAMPRPWPRMVRLVALLLLLQWSAAFAHCLGRVAHAGIVLEAVVCGPDGPRRLLLDDQGAPTDPALAAPDGVCAMCQAPAIAPTLLPSSETVPIVFSAADPPAPRPAGLPVAPARAPPQQPRAPPTA